VITSKLIIRSCAAFFALGGRCIIQGAVQQTIWTNPRITSVKRVCVYATGLETCFLKVGFYVFKVFKGFFRF